MPIAQKARLWHQEVAVKEGYSVVMKQGLGGRGMTSLKSTPIWSLSFVVVVVVVVFMVELISQD